MITFQRLSESVCCSWRNAGRNCASLKHCIDQHQSHAPRSGRRKKCYSRKRWCFFWKDPRTAPSGPPIGLGNPISGWKRRGMQVCVRTASIDSDSNPVWARLPLGRRVGIFIIICPRRQLLPSRFVVVVVRSQSSWAYRLFPFCVFSWGFNRSFPRRTAAPRPLVLYKQDIYSRPNLSLISVPTLAVACRLPTTFVIDPGVCSRLFLALAQHYAFANTCAALSTSPPRSDVHSPHSCIILNHLQPTLYLFFVSAHLCLWTASPLPVQATFLRPRA